MCCRKRKKGQKDIHEEERRQNREMLSRRTMELAQQGSKPNTGGGKVNSFKKKFSHLFEGFPFTKKKTQSQPQSRPNMVDLEFMKPKAEKHGHRSSQIEKQESKKEDYSSVDETQSQTSPRKFVNPILEDVKKSLERAIYHSSWQSDEKEQLRKKNEHPVKGEMSKNLSVHNRRQKKGHSQHSKSYQESHRIEERTKNASLHPDQSKDERNSHSRSRNEDDHRPKEDISKQTKSHVEKAHRKELSKSLRKDGRSKHGKSQRNNDLHETDRGMKSKYDKDIKDEKKIRKSSRSKDHNQTSSSKASQKSE